MHICLKGSDEYLRIGECPLFLLGIERLGNVNLSFNLLTGRIDMRNVNDQSN